MQNEECGVRNAEYETERYVILSSHPVILNEVKDLITQLGILRSAQNDISSARL